MRVSNYREEVYELIELINAERKRRGLSYRDLAELCGYGREHMNYVAVVLGHKTIPRVDSLLKLLEPLGLTLTVTLRK